jgi:putative RNA 2'-phosphotransferase
MDTKRTSKFLSLILRHQPDKIGIELDANGWVDVDVLLAGLKNSGKGITREQLEEVVRTNDKQRFIIENDRIRANQGHSVSVDLGYKTQRPPVILYHGTYEGAVKAIRREGLTKQKRHHVHLHQDQQLATTVGSRRGKAVLLKIRAEEMRQAGHLFQVTPNNVWLVDRVPPEFIDFPKTD